MIYLLIIFFTGFIYFWLLSKYKNKSISEIYLESKITVLAFIAFVPMYCIWKIKGTDPTFIINEILSSFPLFCLLALVAGIIYVIFKIRNM